MKDVDLKNQGAAVSKPPGRSGDRLSLNLDRLLRSAAQARVEEAEPSAPFGFAGRVVAIWRTQEGAPNGIAQLLRRVALFACAIIVLSAAGAYREFRQTRELDDSFSNKFAIADSAIQDEFSQ